MHLLIQYATHIYTDTVSHTYIDIVSHTCTDTVFHTYTDTVPYTNTVTHILIQSNAVVVILKTVVHKVKSCISHSENGQSHIQSRAAVILKMVHHA